LKLRGRVANGLHSKTLAGAGVKPQCLFGARKNVLNFKNLIIASKMIASNSKQKQSKAGAK
jgi:hypothetical protein